MNESLLPKLFQNVTVFLMILNYTKNKLDYLRNIFHKMKFMQTNSKDKWRGLRPFYLNQNKEVNKMSNKQLFQQNPLSPTNLISLGNTRALKCHMKVRWRQKIQSKIIVMKNKRFRSPNTKRIIHNKMYSNHQCKQQHQNHLLTLHHKNKVKSRTTIISLHYLKTKKLSIRSSNRI